MPYKLEGNCVKKADSGETVPGGCHKTHEEALAHLRALEVNVKNSSIVEMSMRISKASYNKSDDEPMRWTAIDSDVDPDLYDERMSMELYNDMCERIDKSIPIPEQFHEAICEDSWCGGMPYLSLAHYKAGTGSINVPGSVLSVFVDGTRLKSKGVLHDTEMGRRVFKALCKDEVEKSNVEHKPVRISIGFLDLEHKHVAKSGGQDFTFTRTDVGQICPLCSQGIGGKIYMKGQLIHLAMTRVPVNPRTEMVAEKSMDEITTKKQDAASIIGEDLVDELEEKSIASDMLVVRSEDGSAPQEDDNMLEPCYDPNTDSYNQECVNSIMDKFMPKVRDSVGQPVKSKTLSREVLDAAVTHLYQSNGFDFSIVEDAKRKDVSPADKKRAEKEYGDVTYADEENKKYPIDTEEHIRAAWNYIHQERNADKYPDKGASIKRKILAAWKKKIGGVPPSAEKSFVEDSMEAKVEKMVAGGESVPEKKFEFQGIDGSGNNTIANPVKADSKEDESAEKDTKGDEMKEGEHMMKSALDQTFDSLKSVLTKATSAEEVQAAFNALGTEVEKAYTPPAPKADDIAAIVKSAVEAAVAPLRIEIATLKAGQSQAPAKESVVKSKALNIANFTNPEQMIKKAIAPAEGQAPARPADPNVPMQIRSIARKSTGLQS